MRDITLLSWLVLCVLKVAAESPPLAPCRPPTFLREMALKDGAFHREKMENDFLCYDLCWSFSDCAAGSFSEDTRLCTLIRKDSAQAIEPVPKMQSVAFMVANTPVCKPFTDPCQVRPCPAGKKCETTEEGTYQCTPRDCETPKGLLRDHSEVVTAEGESSTLTCPDGTVKHVKCHLNGTLDIPNCEGQALYMFHGDNSVSVFDLETRRTTSKRTSGLSVPSAGVDVAVVNTHSNYFLITDKKGIYEVGSEAEQFKTRQIMKLYLADRIDCDGDLCVCTSRINKMFKLYHLEAPALGKTEYTFRGVKKFKDRVVHDIAVNNEKRCVYVATPIYLYKVNVDSKKLTGLHSPFKRTTTILGFDRKRELLYQGSGGKVVVYDTKEMLKVVSEISMPIPTTFTLLAILTARDVICCILRVHDRVM